MKKESQETTFTFENPNVNQSAGELEEETTYINLADYTVDKTPATSDKKFLSIIRPFLPVAVCWGILLVIMALRIHFTSVISTKLSDEMEGSNHTYQYLLEVIIDNENLKRHNSSLTVQMNNLTEAYTVLSSNITNVSRENQQLKAENQRLKAENQQLKAENQQLKAENQQLKAENQRLKAENQQLKAEKQQLKAENQRLKAENQQLKAENQQLKAENQRLKAENQSTIIPTPISNVTPQNWTTLTTGQWNQSQWTLNGFYTRKKRNCEPCQTGWFHFQASCYAIGNQSTWEEARDDCRSKKADLVVIESPDEQEFISNITGAGLGTSGYWIGLRAEAGSWQWVNGSDLTEDFWMQQPADGHQCVISVQESNGLKAVSCDVKNGWICEKKALSKF